MSKRTGTQKTALFVRHLDGYHGDARLYRVEPRLEGFRHVIVSAIDPIMLEQPETYIFGADHYGKVLAWRELDGSFRGGINHKKALKRAGYDVVIPVRGRSKKKLRA